MDSNKVYIYPAVVFGSIGLVSLGSLAEAAAFPELLKFHLSIVRDAGYLLFFGIMFFFGESLFDRQALAESRPLPPHLTKRSKWPALRWLQEWPAMHWLQKQAFHPLYAVRLFRIVFAVMTVMIAISMLGALNRYERFGCGLKFYDRYGGEVPPPSYCSETPMPPAPAPSPLEQSAPEPEPEDEAKQLPEDTPE